MEMTHTILNHCFLRISNVIFKIRFNFCTQKLVFFAIWQQSELQLKQEKLKNEIMKTLSKKIFDVTKIVASLILLKVTEVVSGGYGGGYDGIYGGSCGRGYGGGYSGWYGGANGCEYIGGYDCVYGCGYGGGYGDSFDGVYVGCDGGEYCDGYDGITTV